MKGQDILGCLCITAVFYVATLTGAFAREPAKAMHSATIEGGPISIASQGNFFVVGKYTLTKEGQRMSGQMYVQYQIPAKQTHPYPLLMIHGGGQTGEGYYETPDGREGWATYFLSRGYAVYVVDQVGRGRSGYFPDAYGSTRKPDTSYSIKWFSRQQDSALYPQAKQHTQWPGDGKPGDATFDQFYASQMEDMTDLQQNETLNRTAADALIDRIGPVILLTHSQSGPIGWGIANDRPKDVKAVIAIESSGPPFYNVKDTGAPHWFKYDEKISRPYGLTQTPLTYDPPLVDASDLKPMEQTKPDQPDIATCWLQGAPVRKLANLAQVPILMVGSAASYHVPFDLCTSKYLTQAGVKNDFIRLPSIGINGNGHFIMLEKNNLQVAKFVDTWMGKNIH
ncbi:alpha/beta hydrolase [Sodalis sp. dw_96]|uniref:alpha/beta hydrolase n=1 Tax=Sodalis sp. dw_96 TaxID=2719794 RepID=UPI001BD421FA|nr:alpha/beta hydrolase [Sodalis sp. dw_96]